MSSAFCSFPPSQRDGVTGPCQEPGHQQFSFASCSCCVVLAMLLSSLDYPARRQEPPRCVGLSHRLLSALRAAGSRGCPPALLSPYQASAALAPTLPRGTKAWGGWQGSPTPMLLSPGHCVPGPRPPPPQPVWRRPAQAHLPTRWRRQPWAVPRVPGCSGRRPARAGQGRGRKAGEKRGPRGGAETPPGRTGALAAASRPRLCGGVCSGPGLHHPCPPAGGTRRLPAVSPSARRRGPG